MTSQKKKPVSAPVTAPVDPPKVKLKPGPKPPVWDDLTGTVEQIKKLTPAERQASRTQNAELLVVIRAAEHLMSPKLRSQDMTAIAAFMKANSFVIQPDRSGKEDYLDRLKRERYEAAKDEEQRVRRMAKAKAVEEARVERFYARQQGEPITPRLNAGDPGAIETNDEKEIDSNDR